MTLSRAGELRESGFTLIEILVVCSLLAALSYIAWGGYGSVQASAEDDIARAELLRLADALRRFKADTGYYPGQGPFALAAPGTVESAVSGGLACTPLADAAVLRSWTAPAIDSERDTWFDSPANLALLFTAPALCANHPLHFLNHWNPDSQRGWHGPYLDTAARAWVDVGQDFNADISQATGSGAGAPYGDGDPLAGNKLTDIPALGSGPRLPATGPGNSRCSNQQQTTGSCMLGWRSVPRDTPGYAASQHELPAHARPFAVFGLADNDHPRVVYFGRDGRYGGRASSDACLPNLNHPSGAGDDDWVICLQ